MEKFLSTKNKKIFLLKSTFFNVTTNFSVPTFIYAQHIICIENKTLCSLHNLFTSSIWIATGRLPDVTLFEVGKVCEEFCVRFWANADCWPTRSCRENLIKSFFFSPKTIHCRVYCCLFHHLNLPEASVIINYLVLLPECDVSQHLHLQAPSELLHTGDI